MRAASARRVATVLVVVGLSVAWSAGRAQAQTPPPECRPAKEWPARLRLEYAVTASRGPFSISGQSVLLFQRTGTAYSIDVNTDAVALYHARQTSRGTIEAAGLRPDEYIEDRTNRATQTTRFDWNGGTVAFSVAADTPGQVEPGLQDRASLLLQLTYLSRLNPATPSFEIPVAGARRVSTDKFTRRGAETLRMPIGNVESIRVEREGDADQDRLEAWFANGWCGLPVRIRYTDHKGGVIDHRLRAASIE